LNITIFTIGTDARWGINTMEDLKGSGYYLAYPITSSIFVAAFKAIMEFYGIECDYSSNMVPIVQQVEAQKGIARRSDRAWFVQCHCLMMKRS